MAKALTVRALENARTQGERREIPDGLLRGLYLVVQPSGTKSWAVRYRHGGATRKHTLGPYPAIDLATARNLGGKALRAVAEGSDPAAEKQEARAAKPDTINAVADAFIESYCKRKNRPRTAAETARLLRLHVLPRWRGRHINSITRRDVRELLDHIIAGGSPVAANRAFAAVRLLFNWAIEHDIVIASPCVGVKRPTQEVPRDRVLSDDELRDVWKAAGRVGYPFGPLVQLLVLTGARRDEVAGMRWSEIDVESRLWCLPRERVKNKRPHEIPLSEPAIAIVTALPRIAGGDYVLTTSGKVAASNYGKNKRRLDALLPSDMPPWRLHDLRRTVASGLARLGINLPVIEKVLNHASGSFAGIVGVYQKHEFSQEKRQALDAWGAFVAAVAGDKGPKKVVRLRKAL